MDWGLIFIGLIALLALFVTMALVLGGSSNRDILNIRNNMRSMVASQRQSGEQIVGLHNKASIFKAAAATRVERKKSASLTTTKKLKYAQWSMPLIMYYGLVILISFLAFSFVYSLGLNIVLKLLSLLAGPIFMGWLLRRALEKRFNAFDADYPQFLLSVVGLLKTGMNALGAVEAAAQGLEEGSLVKFEVQQMIERLRFGVSEDKSIGAFGEDVFHPEIELFVQALLLSRRVGGTLSDTLDRLAKQVRRRQYFRKSAIAAVGLQRGSIWMILGILVGLQLYLYWMAPKMIEELFSNELGFQVVQGALVIILLGIFWVRQVTRIRT